MQIGNNISWTFILGGIILALVWIFRITQSKKYNFPPGPPNFPIIGSIPYLIGDPRIVFNKLKDVYGNIYMVHAGNKRIVVLSGYETIKECFMKRASEFSSRPNLFWLTDLLKNQGVLSSTGPTWKAHRGFATKLFREFGMGKSKMEEYILDEIGHLSQAFKETKGEAVEMDEVLNGAFSNIISQILFCQRFEYTTSSLAEYLKEIKEIMKFITHNGILSIYPSLRLLPGDPFGYQGKLSAFKKAEAGFFKPILREHKDSHDPGNLKDYVDAYLVEMEGSDLSQVFNDNQLLTAVSELFGAGTETGAITLTWAIVIFLNHPEMQTKLQSVIDTVPSDQPIYYRDRQNFPYLEAFVDELQRFADVVSLGMPHATSCDVTFRGYHIPEGTMIMPNLCSVHYDPDRFPDPEKFDPTRFLDEQGKHVKQDQIVPFSIGARLCIGEVMARMEQFMFLAGLLQRFSFFPPKSGEIPAMNGVMDIVHTPHPFKVRCERRH